MYGRLDCKLSDNANRLATLGGTTRAGGIVNDESGAVEVSRPLDKAVSYPMSPYYRPCNGSPLLGERLEESLQEPF